MPNSSYAQWPQSNQSVQLERDFDFIEQQQAQQQPSPLQYQAYDQPYYASPQADQTGYSSSAMYSHPSLYNPTTASQSTSQLPPSTYQDAQRYGYQQQQSSFPSLMNGLHDSSSAPLPNFSTSPGPMHSSFTPVPPLPATRSRPASTAPAVKRARAPESEDIEDMEEPESKHEVKAKPPGACARCKHLKVRCEFKTDGEPCRRCYNGGHECAPPGQKKRRTPPKREHLLNQIREQAARIQELMSQLEATNKKPKPEPQTLLPTTFSSQDLHSPVLSPNSTDTQSSYVIPSPTPEQSFSGRSADNKAVEDWISKARESLAQFGGLIGAANGMPKSYFVDEDLDEETSSDVYSGDDEIEDWEADGRAGESGEYAFAVADSDGEEMIPGARGRSQSKHGSRSSSFTAGSSATVPPKKKDSNGSKLATLPTEDSPFGLMADLSLKKLRQRGNSGDNAADGEDNTEKLGVASENFFRTSPAPESATERTLAVPQEAPHILARGIITPAEAESLFDLYYSRMNLSASLLDPVLYTAEKTCIRSPFLFTVVCAIAARFYTQRPELYAQAMHYAQLAAGSALIGGQKSIEMCQGYILLSLFPVPARRWEDDRSWLYVGLAIRVAVDLNLHLPSTATPTSEAHAREMLNRTRVWLNCFNLDRSTSSEYGKFPVIKNTDYLANHSQNWWCSSKYNIPSFDIHICAYTAELIRMTQFREVCHSDPGHPTGRNKNINHAQVATETDDDLCKLRDVWLDRIGTVDIRLDPQNAFRTSLLKLAYGYSRLIALSTGFQHAIFDKSDSEATNPFLERCLRAATDIVNAVLTVEPTFLMYLQHGPVAQTVFVVFSASFLVKLLQPKYAHYLARDRRLEIRGLVERVVGLLENIGLDDTHAPRLYARFLQGLLATPFASVDHPSPNSFKHALPRQKRSKRTKSWADRSPSGDQAHLELNDYASPSSTSSSLSPPPAAYSYFDDFTMTTDPATANMNDEPLNLSSPFFQPPLGLDVQILHSMHALTDPSDWQNIGSAPALSWMNQMRPADPVYTNQQYFYQ